MTPVLLPALGAVLYGTWAFQHTESLGLALLTGACAAVLAWGITK